MNMNWKERSMRIKMCKNNLFPHTRTILWNLFLFLYLKLVTTTSWRSMLKALTALPVNPPLMQALSGGVDEDVGNARSGVVSMTMS